MRGAVATAAAAASSATAATAAQQKNAETHFPCAPVEQLFLSTLHLGSSRQKNPTFIVALPNCEHDVRSVGRDELHVRSYADMNKFYFIRIILLLYLFILTNSV